MEIEQVRPKSGKRTYSDGVALDTPDRRREREAQAGGREAEPDKTMRQDTLSNALMPSRKRTPIDESFEHYRTNLTKARATCEGSQNCGVSIPPSPQAFPRARQETPYATRQAVFLTLLTVHCYYKQ